MDYQDLIAELNLELPHPVDPAALDICQWEQPGASLRNVEGRMEIRFHSTVQLCRMVSFAAAGQQAASENAPVFEELSYMLDCSRNAVPTVDTVKKLIRRMALMGFNALQLYMEDVYQLDGYPYFGYMRGRYTKEELKEIDRYAARFGVEVIPCIQTLAHLNAIFRWDVFAPVHDTADILLTDAEETYNLIRAMVSTCAEVFTSRKIHIGMDEAEMLGKGRHEARYGYEDRTSILLRHLNRVAEICREFGFRPKMWSDMFTKSLAALPEEQWASHEEEIRSRIPEQVQLVYWDYYSRQKEKYDYNIRLHQRLSQDICFAGGAWKWSGFAPLLDHSMMVSRMALESCIAHGVKDIMLTAWGDNGAECDMWTTLPVMQYYAEVCHTGTAEVAEETVAERMLACTGVYYEDMMATSHLNYVPHNPAPGRMSAGPTKYYLYQDPMLGLFDCHVDPAACAAHFHQCAEEMHAAARHNTREALVFETMEALALALEKKCDFGIRLKKAYDADDRIALAVLERECAEIIRRVEYFRGKLEAQWREKYKPFGWEVQDIRLGGLMCRLHTTASRIRAYLDGVTQHLEELEESRLPYETPHPDDPPYPIVWTRHWAQLISAMDI